VSLAWKKKPNVTKRILASSGVRYLLPILLFPFYLFPSTILAQPFDLDRIKRSVVRVIADRGNSIGTGSIIKVEDKNGYILTAYHVIEKDVDIGASHVEVELFTDHIVKARISNKRMNTEYDVVVLRVENLPSPSPPAIDWGASKDLHELQTVYAVSKLQGGKIYFSGTAVNRRNSGGPLLNEEGGLVGMNLRLGEGLGRALEGDVIRGIIWRWVGGFPEPEPEPEPSVGLEPSTPTPGTPHIPPPRGKEKLIKELTDFLQGE
jgi:S1-C subfamily serine protease